MEDYELNNLWKQVQKIGEINRLDDVAMLALGSVFGQLNTEIKRLRNTYKERVDISMNKIDFTLSTNRLHIINTDNRCRYVVIVDKSQLELNNMHTSASGFTEEEALNNLNDIIYDKISHLEQVIKGLQKLQGEILTGKYVKNKVVEEK